MKTLVHALVLTLASAVGASAATVDGIPINWSSAGNGAKTLVLVHGWTCDSTSWASQVPELSRTYRVLTLDLPGHGKSGSPKDGKFSMTLFARAVEAVRAEARVERVVLAGHSMGTPVIREYARMYPQHVAALVIVDGLVRYAAPPANGTAPPRALSMGGPEGLKNREAMVRGMFVAGTPSSVQQHVLEMMLGAPEATAVGAMTATFEANWKDDVMTMPVIGIYAEKSGLGNQAYSKKVYPRFEYVEIPGTGHFLMMEKPAEFNRILKAFLETIAI
jgi:pimeloyl-ACP methyl ester carboxylesterase